MTLHGFVSPEALALARVVSPEALSLTGDRELFIDNLLVRIHLIIEMLNLNPYNHLDD